MWKVFKNDHHADYIVNMIDDIPEDMRGESATPATHHLLGIADDAKKISQTDADLFCHFVTQLLYLSK